MVFRTTPGFLIPTLRRLSHHLQPSDAHNARPYFHRPYSTTDPRRLLGFANREMTDSPMDMSAIDTLRPSKHTISTAEYETLSNDILAMVNRPILIQYLSTHGSSDRLQPYLPGITHSGLRKCEKFKKQHLVRALILGIWNLNVQEKVDVVLDKLNSVPDHVSGTFEIPCTARDLFFVHGFGDTVRSLMLQGGVSISLDKHASKIIINGTGVGIKKTTAQIRTLLHYSECEMRIPEFIQSDTRALAFTSHFINRIMRQCNVYTEQVDTDASGAAPVLRITATSLVDLSAAKQLIRAMWDTILDSQWHVVSASSCTSGTTNGFALMPFTEPHWMNSKLLDGVSRWTITPVTDTRTSSEFNWTPLVKPIFEISTPESVQLGPNPSATLLHINKLKQCLTRLPAIPGSNAYVELITQLGTLAMYTSKDVAGTSTLFSSPIPETTSLEDLAKFTTDNIPQWTFQPLTPRQSKLDDTLVPDPITQWRPTVEEQNESHRFRLQLSGAERETAKKNWASSTNFGTAGGDKIHLPFSLGIKEPTHVAGAPVRRWRIVYSADDDTSGPWPGRRDLVLDLAMPVFTHGGNVKIDSVQFQQTAVTIDTLDLERSLADLRTEVQLIERADDDVLDFIKKYVLPTTVQFSGRLYAPPTFVYQDREYTCKWIGRTALRSGSASSEGMCVEQVYMQSNDELDLSLTRVVHTVPNLQDSAAHCEIWIRNAVTLLGRV